MKVQSFFWQKSEYYICKKKHENDFLNEMKII